MRNLYITFFTVFCVSFAGFAQDSGESVSDNVKKAGGHEYVNMGYPSGVYWATTNIGASTPYEAGDLFAWGEVEPRTGEFTWENYKYFIENKEIEGINTPIPIVENLGDNISGTQYDGAHHLWGDGWRMPTREECYQLAQNCQHEWVLENGVYGMRLRGLNHTTLFFPAMPYNYDPDIWESFYWSATVAPDRVGEGSNIIDNDPSSQAYCILENKGNFHSGHILGKFEGLLIRPVISRTDITAIEEITSEYDSVSIIYKGDHIFIEGPVAEYQFNIYDLSGICLYSGTSLDNMIRLATLGKGMYIIALSNGRDNIKTQKLIT